MNLSLTHSLLLIALLIAASAFFSVAEISLAASRRLRLRQMADEGDTRAERVLRVQDQPGDYFTVVQIGQNAVAILGGIVGEGALSPYFSALLALWLPEKRRRRWAFSAPSLSSPRCSSCLPTCAPSAWAWPTRRSWRCAWCAPCRAAWRCSNP